MKTAWRYVHSMSVSSTHQSPWHNIHCLNSKSSSTHWTEHLTCGPYTPNFLRGTFDFFMPVQMLWVGLYPYLQVWITWHWSKPISLCDFFLATVADSGILVNESILIISIQACWGKRFQGTMLTKRFCNHFCHHVKPEQSWGIQNLGPDEAV